MMLEDTWHVCQYCRKQDILDAYREEWWKKKKAEIGINSQI